MTTDIRGLEQWEGETKEWNKRVGDLKMSAGSGMIDALESWYAQFKKKPTDRNRRETLLWRLRLHLKFNHDHEFLQELDEVFDIGLVDEEVGPTYWDIPGERNVEHRQPSNWRTDSGAALRGSRSIEKQRDIQEEMEERDDE
jgi:hypothetical protein